MKNSMILGIIGGALALAIGLIIIVLSSVAIYEHEIFDYSQYYYETINNGGDPVHFETLGIQNVGNRFLRFLGFEVFAAGMLGLTGGLLAQKRRSMSRRFMTAGAFFSFLSLVGIVAGIVFAVAVWNHNRGY